MAPNKEDPAPIFARNNGKFRRYRFLRNPFWPFTDCIIGVSGVLKYVHKIQYQPLRELAIRSFETFTTSSRHPDSKQWCRLPLLQMFSRGITATLHCWPKNVSSEWIGASHRLEPIRLTREFRSRTPKFHKNTSPWVIKKAGVSDCITNMSVQPCYYEWKKAITIPWCAKNRRILITLNYQRPQGR